MLSIVCKNLIFYLNKTLTRAVQFHRILEKKKKTIPIYIVISFLAEFDSLFKKPYAESLTTQTYNNNKKRNRKE